MFTARHRHYRQTARRSISPFRFGDSVKRIYPVGAAVAALLTAGLIATPAFATPAAKKPATVSKFKTVVKNTLVTTRMSCDLKLATQIPSNDVTVTQGAASGTQNGRAGCAKPLYSGAQQNSFSSDDAGNLQGKYQQWFNAGSIYGAYMLTPLDTGPPTTTTFTAASYSGTVTVTGGTGLFRKATGSGTLACFTTDSAHYTCTEKLKLVRVVPVKVKIMVKK